MKKSIIAIIIAALVCITAIGVYANQQMNCGKNCPKQETCIKECPMNGTCQNQADCQKICETCESKATCEKVCPKITNGCPKQNGGCPMKSKGTCPMSK